MVLNRTSLVFDSRIITQKIRHSLATGIWGNAVTGARIRLGVSQTLKRDTCYLATLSHLRRIVAPLQSNTKVIEPRLLHNTQFGMICPAETPEGEKIGLVKNYAFLSKVSH